MNKIQMPSSRWLAPVLALGLLAQAGAEPAGQAEPRVPVQGTARLSLTLDGSEARVDFIAPAATLIGFDQAPSDAAQRETLRLARDNLDAGEAMIRFGTHAACRLLNARVETSLRALAPASGASPAPPAAVTDRAGIRVRYRFHCEQPKALDSAALGFFNGFPALERVLVQYRTPEGQGAAELTRGNPLVNFVPF